MRDITPVAGIIRFPDVVDVNLSVPVHTIPELISYAKANPGKLNFASSGIGSTLHVAGELFKMMAGVDIVHVPYRGGGPALVDLMSGRVQLMFDNLPTSLEFIRAGKLRPLAVTTTARSPVLPDLPTVADFVPGYEASAWYGIGAPKGTPAEIVETLNKAINAMLADPAARARFTDLGASLDRIASVVPSRDQRAEYRVRIDPSAVLCERRYRMIAAKYEFNTDYPATRPPGHPASSGTIRRQDVFRRRVSTAIADAASATAQNGA